MWVEEGVIRFKWILKEEKLGGAEVGQQIVDGAWFVEL